MIRAAVSIAIALAVLSLGTASAAADLPNLAQEDQSDFLAQGDPPQIIAGPTGQELLVFTSTIWNYGPGPMVLSGGRADATVATMPAYQTVDGVQTLAGAFQYNVDPSHQHWHFLNLDRYQLRAHDAQNAVVALDQKTGFCVAPYSEITGQDCERNVPDALSVSEQLDPSNYDRYDPDRDGQYIDVTGLPSGQYELVEWVNSDCSLQESTPDDNATAMVVDIEAGTNGPTATAEPNVTPYFDTWWQNNPHCLPHETVRPQVSGTAALGNPLTATPGSWLDRLAGAFTYQWRRCDAVGNACSDIAGATAPSYSPRRADSGHTLRARVTATAGDDVEQLTPQDSDQTGGVPTPPAPPSLHASASVPRKVSLRALLRRGLAFKVRCSKACSVDARLVAPGSLARLASAAAAQTVVALLRDPHTSDEARTDILASVHRAGFVFAEARLRLKHAGTLAGHVRVARKLRGRIAHAKLGGITLRFTIRASGGQLRTIVRRLRVVR